MEILHACNVTCDKLQCHTLVVFLLALRRLASVLWMFSIIIKTHNIQPIHNRSMAFMLFIALNNSLAINMIQKWCFATRLKCSNIYSTLKWIMKIIIKSTHSIVNLLPCSRVCQNSSLTSHKGHSISCIDLQWYAVEVIF